MVHRYDLCDSMGPAFTRFLSTWSEHVWRHGIAFNFGGWMCSSPHCTPTRGRNEPQETQRKETGSDGAHRDALPTRLGAKCKSNPVVVRGRAGPGGSRPGHRDP